MVRRLCDGCGGELTVTGRRAAQARIFCSRTCKEKAWRGLMSPAERYLFDRKGNLKKNYGISLAQYEELYDRQRGRCAICNEAHEVLHVDHNHTSGEIRGLLCNTCNRFIGLAKESAEVLRAAATYLEA